MSNYSTLTPFEALLLQYLDLRGEEDRPEIARRMRVPLHRVHHAVERLRDKGLLGGRIALVDYGRLGRTPYSIVVGLAPFTEVTRERLRKFFAKSSEVAWASEVLAESQVSIQTFPRSPLGVGCLIQQLQETTGSRITSKELVMRSALTIFERRHFSDESCRWKRLKVELLGGGATEDKPAIALDELDNRCLSALATPHTDSWAAIARSLGVPPQTFHRRVTRLKEMGIIKGFSHSLGWSAIGARRYRLLLSTAGYERAVQQRLEDICSKHPHVQNMVVCLGHWDFEISLECHKESVVAMFLSALGEALGPVLRSTKILPVLNHLKYSFQVGV